MHCALHRIRSAITLALAFLPYINYILRMTTLVWLLLWLIYCSFLLVSFFLHHTCVCVFCTCVHLRVLSCKFVQFFIENSSFELLFLLLPPFFRSFLASFGFNNVGNRFSALSTQSKLQNSCSRCRWCRKISFDNTIDSSEYRHLKSFSGEWEVFQSSLKNFLPSPTLFQIMIRPLKIRITSNASSMIKSHVWIVSWICSETNFKPLPN